MPHTTVTVGDVRITAVLDVDVNDEPIADAFPGAPPGAALAERDRFPSVYGDDDRWRLRVRVWLVRHPGGVLLLDTGVGPETSPAMGWCPRPGAARATLAEAGADPDEIDVVALSHAHDDHVGGVLTADGLPAFPRARYLMQRADRDWLRARTDEDAATTLQALIVPLERAGVLKLLDGDRRLDERLELRHAPGHTPGHQVLRIDGGDARALLCADTWNHPMQLAHPDWAGGSDDDPAGSAATRRTLLGELLQGPGTLVAPTHFGESFGSIMVGADGTPEWDPHG